MNNAKNEYGIVRGGEARCKKQEARYKKQDARYKKQDTRSKIQDTRSKMQEARSKKKYFGGQKDHEIKKRNQQGIITVCRNGGAVPGEHWCGDIYWYKSR